APLIFQGLRQIPVVQGYPRLDTVRQELIDNPIVKIQSLGIHGAVAGGNYAWPRQRNSRGVQSQLGLNRDVLPVAMVEVARDIAGLTTFDLARGVRKTVPDRFSLAVFVPGAFDLIRGTGRAP